MAASSPRCPSPGRTRVGAWLPVTEAVSMAESHPREGPATWAPGAEVRSAEEPALLFSLLSMLPKPSPPPVSCSSHLTDLLLLFLLTVLHAARVMFLKCTPDYFSPLLIPSSETQTSWPVKVTWLGRCEPLQLPLLPLFTAFLSHWPFCESLTRRGSVCL